MTRTHLGYLAAALLLVVFVVATNNPRNIFPSATTSGEADIGLRTAPTTGLMFAYDSEEIARDSGVDDTGAAAVEQKVIKTGNLELEVDSAATTTADISALAAARGGFVASSSLDEDAYGNKRGSITIRVPVADFEATITDVKALADNVVSERTHGQDVTEEYTDLEARLSSAQAQEAQYLVVLQSAQSVGDILAVQEHLADVRREIESLQGKVNYLENRTSLSTVNVALVETSRVTIPGEKFELTDEIRDAARALVHIAQKLLVAIVWLIIVGIPLALVVYAGYRIFRRVQRARTR